MKNLFSRCFCKSEFFNNAIKAWNDNEAGQKIKADANGQKFSIE